jgi:phospholipase C
MGYYDGNTVTAMWNYAQNYALNDNHYTTVYGPSTPGALDLISGQTNGLSGDEAPPHIAGDLGNVIEATSNRRSSVEFFTAGKLAPANFGLLQQCLPGADLLRCPKAAHVTRGNLTI